MGDPVAKDGETRSTTALPKGITNRERCRTVLAEVCVGVACCGLFKQCFLNVFLPDIAKTLLLDGGSIVPLVIKHSLGILPSLDSLISSLSSFLCILPFDSKNLSSSSLWSMCGSCGS